MNAVVRFFQEIDIFADVANLDKGPCNLIMIPEQSRQPMMVFPAIDSRGVKRKIKALPSAHFCCHDNIIQAEVFLTLFFLQNLIFIMRFCVTKKRCYSKEEVCFATSLLILSLREYLQFQPLLL